MLKSIEKYAVTLWESWLLAIILALLGGLLAVVVQGIFTLLNPQLGEFLTLWSYPLIFIPPYLFLRRWQRLDKKEREQAAKAPEQPAVESIAKKVKVVKIDDSTAPATKRVVTYLLLALLILSGEVLLEPLLSWIKMPERYQEFIEIARSYKFSSFVSLVIFAPLFEELFCRGVILRGLLHHTTPRKAILWSSLIFAVIHLNLYQAVPAFISGLILGWVYWKSHSIWSAIFLHAFNNLLAYLIMALFPTLPLNYQLYHYIPLLPYIGLVVVATIALIYTIYYLNKNYDQPISIKI